jgi:predicted CoA-binding protein
MEVGIALSKGLFDLGVDEENVSLMEEATQTFGKVKSKWVWLQLGVIHLHAEKANEAVNAFHACIRSDINDWWVIAKFQNYCFLIDYCRRAVIK